MFRNPSFIKDLFGGFSFQKSLDPSFHRSTSKDLFPTKEPKGLLSAWKTFENHFLIEDL